MVNEMLGKHSLPHEKASYSFRERAAVLRRAVSRAVGSFPGSSQRLNWVGLTRVYRSRSARLRARVCKRDYAQSASRHSLSRRMAAPGPSTEARRRTRLGQFSFATAGVCRAPCGGRGQVGWGMGASARGRARTCEVPRRESAGTVARTRTAPAIRARATFSRFARGRRAEAANRGLRA